MEAGEESGQYLAATGGREASRQYCSSQMELGRGLYKEKEINIIRPFHKQVPVC